MERAELWQLSKGINHEIFFQYQLQAAGAQKARLMDRFENQSIGSWALFIDIMFALFMGFMAITPLVSLSTLQDQLEFIPPEALSATLPIFTFATSISLSIYYLLSLVFIFNMGLMSMIHLWNGKAFKYLNTLPIPTRDVRKVGFYVLWRINGIKFLAFILIFPVGSLIITHSVTFFLASLLCNFLGGLFIMGILVVTTNFLTRKIFSETRMSRGNMVARAVFYGSYMITLMLATLVPIVLVDVVRELFTTDIAGVQDLNNFLAYIPFPFTISYLETLTLFPGVTWKPEFLLAVITGIVLLGALLILLIQGSRKIFRQVGTEEPTSVTRRSPKEIEDDWEIQVEPPVVAYRKKSLKIVVRDMGSFVFLLIPVIYGILGCISFIEDGFADLDDLTMFALFQGIYGGLLPILLNRSFSSSEENMGGILASLPIHHRDVFRAKQALMAFFSNTGVVAVLLIVVPRADKFLPEFLGLYLLMVLLNLGTCSLALVLFSRLFGKINGQYTFFLVNRENIEVKYILIGAATIGLFFGEFFFIRFMLVEWGFPFWAVIGGFLILDCTLLALTEIAGRRMFPKQKRR